MTPLYCRSTCRPATGPVTFMPGAVLVRGPSPRHRHDLRGRAVAACYTTPAWPSPGAPALETIVKQTTEVAAPSVYFDGGVDDISHAGLTYIVVTSTPPELVGLNWYVACPWFGSPGPSSLQTARTPSRSG